VVAENTISATAGTSLKEFRLYFAIAFKASSALEMKKLNAKSLLFSHRGELQLTYCNFCV